MQSCAASVCSCLAVLYVTGKDFNGRNIKVELAQRQRSTYSRGGGRGGGGGRGEFSCSLVNIFL